MNDSDIEEHFKQAIEKTEIHRERKNNLYTFGETRLPYYFVAQSSINAGECVLREGEISTEKPRIIIQGTGSSLHGFGSNDEEDEKMAILFGRNFSIPALRYQNTDTKLDVVSKSLPQLTGDLCDQLDEERNSRTAVLSGPEDLWHFCLLVYAGKMMQRSAPDNFREMMERRPNQFENGDGFGPLF